MNLAVILTDIIVVAHLVCFAIGIGSGVALESRVFKARFNEVTSTLIHEIETTHRIIAFAVAGLWITGLLLIYQRTGFDVAAFSDKLWVKLFIVICLTLNATLISVFVLPIIKSRNGEKLLDIPLSTMMPLALCVAFSVVCWILALSLGASSFLKTQNFDFLTLFVGVVFVSGMMTATVVALALSRPERSSQSDALTFPD